MTGAEKIKAMRVQHALDGLCLDCREDAADGRSRCMRHLRMHQVWSRRLYRKRRRARK